MGKVSDGFEFSLDQLTGRVIIEIFCSARVASLKELGLREAFGVDHKVNKAVPSAKQLDLTVQTDQPRCAAEHCARTLFA